MAVTPVSYYIPLCMSRALYLATKGILALHSRFNCFIKPEVAKRSVVP